MSHTGNGDHDTGARLGSDTHVASGRPREILAEEGRPARARCPRAGRFPGHVLPSEARWASLATLLFLAGVAAQVARGPRPLGWSLLACCYVAGGWGPAIEGVRALRRRTLDVDVLMVVAALVAAAVGQLLDGGLLIVIFATSGALEAVATKRTRDSVASLLVLAPEQATRLGVAGAEEVIEATLLGVGDRVLVRPGERLAADGVVVAGESDVDQASLTGEGLPVAKGPGDEVLAGSMNGEGALVVAVTRAAADSVLTRIAALVDEASATKAKVQLFIEHVEQRYSIAMVGATLALFFVPLALGGALQPTLLRAITFMIVASPCAVVLATMPPLLSAIANAGRHGLLVKSAVAMEQLASVSLVAFDKTGTLTEGAPRLVETHVLQPGGVFDAAGLLRLAAAVEWQSEHPLSRAIVQAAEDEGMALPGVDHFRSRPGCGVEGLVEGHHMAVGSARLLEESAGEWPAAERIAAVQDDGCTAVVVVIDGLPAGVLGLADQPRPEAASATARLTALLGRAPVLLTGDSRGAALRLATHVGITDVRAELLPHDKVAVVRALRSDGGRVLVVGDGVNDAPALAAADVGFAMGRRGSDLALDTADAVVVNDDLGAIPAAIRLSRSARHVMVQNLVFATLAIATLVAFDLSGHLPLPLGVVGHEGSTVVVGLNGLRLLRPSAWAP